MKRAFLLAVLSAFFVGCSNQQPTLTFALTGMDAEDSVIVYNTGITDGFRNAQVDTLAIPNGNLSIPLTGDSARSYKIYKLPRRYPDGTMEAMSMVGINVPVMPGADIKVEGDFSNHTITGSIPFYKDLELIYSHIKPLTEKSMQAARAAYDSTKPQAERDSLMAVSEAYKDSIQDLVADYVYYCPDSEAGLYAFYMYGNIEKHHDRIDELCECVRYGVLANVYAELKADYQALLKQREAEKRVADGMPAPEFTLNNIEGNPISLSSLRGKYVVLDFWGTWCGWCIKGMPEMKEMYAKYSQRLEVVGIACGDTEEAWKKCVAEKALPWTNLLNGKDDADVSAMYAVKGYPTKIILDPEGRILKTILGESPEFYTFVDSLMK
jgi:peroxiredoxin